MIGGFSSGGVAAHADLDVVLAVPVLLVEAEAAVELVRTVVDDQDVQQDRFTVRGGLRDELSEDLGADTATLIVGSIVVRPR